MAEGTEGKRKGFWSAKRIVSLFLIAFGFLFGLLVQHYYIEPLLSNDCVDDLVVCKAQVQALDEESASYAQQVHDLNTVFGFCNNDLQRCLTAS